MKKTFGRVLTTLMAAMLLLSMLVVGAAAEQPVTITMAMTAPWETFIPFNTTNGNTDGILELMFDKMIVIKANGEHQPRLADSWEQEGLVLTFKLNEKAAWHDGQPLTADDVVFTCELMAAPEITHPRRSKVAFFTGTDASGVRVEGEEFGVKALDEHTVQFTMKNPAPLSYMMTQTFRDFYVLPKHLLADIPVTEIMTHEFWQKRLKKRFFSSAVQEMRRLKDEGYHVLVVSASVTAYMDVLPSYLPADGVIATVCGMDGDEKYNGYLGDNCRGVQKPLRIAAYLAANHLLLDYAVSRAYGDSPSDEPMLRLTAHPTLVNPSPKLRAAMPDAATVVWKVGQA